MAQTPRPADAVRIGQVFLGKYRVESILGQGGMGVVAECTHLQLNQRLAIKMLRQDVLADADAVERFMREAQAASKLRSEYVAHVSDVGTLENGTPYMVMEFLEGMDLGQLLTERGKLARPWACELMLQTAEALAEAHSLGIVHRDIKPTNLFVTWRPDGTALIKVLDFGISKSTMGNDMQLTQTQSLLGTPAYMSPEQMRSARLVDARTDIWSLGSVMYELLEGRKPFEAESFSEMCVKVAVDAPSPMVHTPPDLQPVVLRCLAKTPEQRYSTMAEFARDLVPFVADPHQASLLVERMQRMLRRSVDNANWEGQTTGTGMRGVPSHVRDGSASQPVRVPWSNEGTGPVRRMDATPAAAVARITHGEQSAPVYQPSELFAVPPQKRRSALWFAMLATLIVGGAGVAIALSMGDEAEKPASTAGNDEGKVAEPPKPAEVLTPDPIESKAVETKVEPIDAKPETTVDTTTETKVDTTATKPAVTKPKPSGTRVGKTGKGRVGKAGAAKSEVGKADDAAKTGKTEQTPKCDPFANAHSVCSKK
ncbi:MAG: serine/threonine protein kinase [Deltaproteobacteria bacterium]|nr:serine/threonine protein kinase [Deltaproteobacteria bacterium]